MYPRHFSELAGALSGQAVLRQAPQGEPGWDWGLWGRSAQGPFSSPMDSASTDPFQAHALLLPVLVLRSLVHPTDPEPCRKGCPGSGCAVGKLKADLGRKPRAPQCPLSSDRPQSGLCPSRRLRQGSCVWGGPSATAGTTHSSRAVGAYTRPPDLGQA